MKLKDLREQKGLTQQELAAELNTKKTNISHYETGVRNPNINALIKFAEYFDVTVDYLVDAPSASCMSYWQTKLYRAIKTLDLSDFTFSDIVDLIEEIKKCVDKINYRRTHSYAKLP